MSSCSSNNRVAIIPARGGSKRIPRKNIREFCGKPAIAYAIEAATASKLFSDVIVSTDDDEIASIAMSLGASVPFMRSLQTSGDHASTAAVLKEVLHTLEINKQYFAQCCCIYPTAVFVTAERLRQAHQVLVQGQYDQVFPVVPFPCPIERAFRLDDRDRIHMAFPEHANTRTQDLEKSFYDAGQFYWFKTNGFCLRDSIFTDNAGVIICPEMSVQDIDTESDWVVAEKKFQLNASAV